MSRQSRDEVKFGRVWNGYDYNLQVWVREGVVEPCHHPESMRRSQRCCGSRMMEGMSIYALIGAEDRIEDYEEEG